MSISKRAFSSSRPKKEKSLFSIASIRSTPFDNDMDAVIWKSHQTACEKGESHYLDPETGFRVFTAYGLKKRGRCCGCACRHCPFAHEQVALKSRPLQAKQATWLTQTTPKATPLTLLFWSGGKDSYLALKALQRQGIDNIAFLTTFDSQHRQVAHQEIAIEQIVKQAETLQIPLMGVPLYPNLDYERSIEMALNSLPSLSAIAFGDLHLEHLREWREQTFASILGNTPLLFPLWKASYDKLIEELEHDCVDIHITANMPKYDFFIKKGDYFNQTFISQLPKDIDAFGENGEFHTYVSLPKTVQKR